MKRTKLCLSTSLYRFVSALLNVSHEFPYANTAAYRWVTTLDVPLVAIIYIKYDSVMALLNGVQFSKFENFTIERAKPLI